MPERGDEQLIDEIRERDSGALRVLFQRYYPRVFAFVNRRLDDPSLAEEAVADTFMEVWRSAKSFRGASRVSTWIFGIATFKAMEADRNRRRRKRSAVIPTRLETLHRVPEPRSAERTIEARDELRWVRHYLEGVPQGQREILELALLEGRDYGEIALKLGISRGTVKSRLSRARQDLRAYARQAQGEG